MYYIYRIQESRGFVARRVFFQWMYLAKVVYGAVFVKGNQILLPEDVMVGDDDISNLPF